MTDNIAKRRRKVDVKKLPPEQADSIGFELGKKIGTISDKAAADINQITQIYGIKVKIAVQFLDEKTGKPIK